MIKDIKNIIFGGFTDNCYLLMIEKGYVLVDTGRKAIRKKMEQEADKKRNVQYIYIHEPREYPFDTKSRADWKEKSIWDIDLPIFINNKF